MRLLLNNASAKKRSQLSWRLRKLVHGSRTARHQFALTQSAPTPQNDQVVLLVLLLLATSQHGENGKRRKKPKLQPAVLHQRRHLLISPLQKLSCRRSLGTSRLHCGEIPPLVAEPMRHQPQPVMRAPGETRLPNGVRARATTTLAVTALRSIDQRLASRICVAKPTALTEPHQARGMGRFQPEPIALLPKTGLLRGSMCLCI